MRSLLNEETCARKWRHIRMRSDLCVPLMEVSPYLSSITLYSFGPLQCTGNRSYGNRSEFSRWQKNVMYQQLEVASSVLQLWSVAQRGCTPRKCDNVFFILCNKPHRTFRYRHSCVSVVIVLLALTQWMLPVDRSFRAFFEGVNCVIVTIHPHTIHIGLHRAYAHTRIVEHVALSDGGWKRQTATI